MMRQFLDIKKDYQDAVLFFRMGDFYEMFNHDAVEVSALLNLTLTHRGGNPMAGVPYHAAGNYIKRLLNAGKKIAVCEQVSEPGKGKGIVEREVTRVITPGTVIEEDFLEQNSNNYIAAAAKYSDYLSFSYVDISTGEFYTAAYPAAELGEKLRREVFRVNCSEILIQESLLSDDPSLAQYFSSKEDLIVNSYPDWSFDLESSLSQLKAHFKTASLKGYGIEEGYPGLYSCGVLMEYLGENSRSALAHIDQIQCYREDDFLLMDEATLKNLEIVRNLQDGSSAFTLFKVLNHTKTSGGTRLLKRWLVNPLREISQIKSRQQRVSFLYHQQMLMSELRERLSKVLDQERLASRISMDKAHAKDLNALGQSVNSFLEIRDLVNEIDPNGLFFESDPSFYDRLRQCGEGIVRAIQDDPSILLSEGKMIREGYHAELDRIRSLRDNSQAVLDEYLEEERRETGIANLRVKYNKIIGYFLEVTKANAAQVPEHFIRRQSLVGSERFTTTRLAELESELNSSIERTVELERRLFLELRDSLKPMLPDFYRAAAMISALDALQSFARAATVSNYRCPEVKEGSEIIIEGGRHPVVEQSLKEGQFVPNTISIDSRNDSFVLITGPNMAGKSTLLRQAALITLMAQTGSFVPASSAVIGIADRIFCRVGASDNLARGESTFLVEMNETANILRNATPSSLVIMDEVGRGTSTQDGLSIAWAVCEALLERKSRTLFATHYHELTLLEHQSLVNQSLRVSHQKGEIVFMKELVDGPAGSSYGIHAARLAGVPKRVLARAEEVLAHIKEQGQSDLGAVPAGTAVELDLFSPAEQLLQQIGSYDLYRKTPLEVMQDLAVWQQEIRDKI